MFVGENIKQIAKKKEIMWELEGNMVGGFYLAFSFGRMQKGRLSLFCISALLFKVQ